MNWIPKKNILVIDDEPPVLELLSKYLARQGYEIVTATTAKEALPVAKETLFRLIILDLVLPDTEGFDLLESLKSANPEVPILILTGIGYNEDIVLEAFQKGAAGYLTKALPLPNLLTEVRRILKESQKKR